MTTTTMRFGPEWMRKQPASGKPLAASPPPTGVPGGPSNGASAPPGAASYSALVTPHVPPPQGKRDIVHPFKYSRDEMLQFYKDIEGSSQLPIEVERWEGVVKEEAGDPVCLSEFTDIERKLYATSLNSEPRRRQSTDYAAQGDRSKGGALNSGSGLMGRRRRGDSNGTDHPPLSLPRKTSWSGTPGSLSSPSAASPRTRIGSGNSFDGVLNGGDTAWGGGKRRVPPGQPLSDRVVEEEEPMKEHGLNEGKESAHDEGPKSDSPSHNNPPPFLPDVQKVGGDANGAAASLNNLTLNTDVRTTQSADTVNRPSTEAAGLARVEWSYIDPAGNVQGPFVGEIMQQWHDQLYFAENLLMKRTTMDAEFIPLSELKRRALGDRIFLSPLSHIAPPPGLGQSGHGLNPLLQRVGVVDSPRQPSPQQYSRSNTLDSFINAGAIATGSASPSSSFGGNAARGPISPDPLAVGSRLQRLASDAHLNGRISAAGNYSSDSSPAMPQAVRQVFNENLQSNRSSSYDAHSTLPRQIPHGNSVSVWNGSSEVPHLGQQGRVEQFIGSSFGHPPFSPETSSYATASGSAPVGPFVSSSAPSSRYYGQTDQADFARRPDLQGGFQQGSNDLPLRFEGAPQQLSLSQFPGTTLQQTSIQPIISPSGGHTYYQPQTRQAPPLSPWGASQTREPSRPSPFDADLPTSNNTFVVSLPQTSVWNRPAQDPWGLQNDGQQGRVQLMEEPQSLTTANVTQHNERQTSVNSRAPHGTDAAATARIAAETIETAATRATPSLPSASMTSPVQESAAPRAPVSKRKSSAAPTNPTSEKAPPTTPSTPSKVPWATNDEKVTKQSPAPMNLREIQEAEKKRQDARKTAEKEKERAARAAAGASSNEGVQFTASWGLPTSQVGARNNSGSLSTTKETSATSPATSSAPVWTSATKPAAKTLKEIQEEEERRNLATKEKETAASALKRLVQGPAVKAPLANVQPNGGAWTVVGTSGKQSAPASVVAARSGPAAQVSTPSIAATRPTVLYSPSRPQSTAQVAKTTPSVLKADEEPAAPSSDFMKWMRERLRGLNGAVQFEEIAQMLLSFPLESLKEESTVEIIAETVYGATTTLSGRDFAKDFVKKRREDISSRSGNQTANGKPPSLADVVKSQPKPAQNDFGQFKVVKKKGKRSKDN